MSTQSTGKPPHPGPSFVSIVSDLRFAVRHGIASKLRPLALFLYAVLVGVGAVAVLWSSSPPEGVTRWWPPLAWLLGVSAVFVGIVRGGDALGRVMLERAARQIAKHAVAAWWVAHGLSLVLAAVSVGLALGGASVETWITWWVSLLLLAVGRQIASGVLSASHVVNDPPSAFWHRRALNARHIVRSLFVTALVLSAGLASAGIYWRDVEGFGAFPLISVIAACIATLGWALRGRHAVAEAEEDMLDAVTRTLHAAETVRDAQSPSAEGALVNELRLLQNEMTRPIPIHWTTRTVSDVWTPLGYVLSRFTDDAELVPSSHRERFFNLYDRYSSSQLADLTAGYLRVLRSRLRSSPGPEWARL